MAVAGPDFEMGADDPANPEPDEGIAGLLAKLIDDAEDFVRAEIKLYRVEVVEKLRALRMVLVLATVGGLLALGSVILLLIALVFALAPHTGTAWAAFIVSMLGFVVAGLLFLVARGRVMAVIDDDGDRA